MPKVSVIVPCYNVEKYVKRCLESLTHQTLKDIEIICIDDKSNDNTLKILRDYARKDKRIQVIKKQKNQGVAIARNDGLKKSRGTYVSFVDPDDYVDLDFYEKLYNAAIQTKADIIKGNVLIYNDNIIRKSKLNSKIHDNVFNFCAEHWSAIYKKTFLTKNKLIYPENIMTGQDSAFLSKLVVLKPSLVIQNDVFYHYVNRTDSLDSQILTHNKVLSRINMLNYKLDILRENTFSAESDRNLFISKHILDNFCYTFNKNFDNGDDRKLLFNWLVNANISKKFLMKTFGRKKTKAILNNEYESFIKKPKNLFFFSKKRFSDGYRRIYFCGIQVASYKRG